MYIQGELNGHAGLPLFHAIISFCVLIKRDHMSDCNVYNLSTLHFYNLLTTLFLNSSSLLIYSQICKLFETIVRDAIVDHLERNSLINASQHGFRKGGSCLSNLLQFLDNVTSSLDSRNSVDVI